MSDKRTTETRGDASGWGGTCGYCGFSGMPPAQVYCGRCGLHSGVAYPVQAERPTNDLDRVAEAIAVADPLKAYPQELSAWGNFPEEWREHYRTMARAAVDAMKVKP